MTPQQWFYVAVAYNGEYVAERTIATEDVAAVFGAMAANAVVELVRFCGGHAYGIDGGVGQPWRWTEGAVRVRSHYTSDRHILMFDAFDKPGPSHPYWVEV